MDQLENNATGNNVEWGARLHAIYFRARLLARRYWWIALLGASAGTAYQTYKGLQEEPYYVSQARMIIGGMIDLPEGNAYQEQFANFFGTQIELMQSGRVRQRAEERVKALRPDLTPVPVLLNAQQQPDTSIFALVARGTDPDYVRAYLDAVVEEYLNVRREMRAQTSESTLLAITEQLVRLQEEIAEEENAVVEFQKQNNLVFIQEQGSTAGEYLVRLKNQQADLKTQLRMIEALGLKSQNLASMMADGRSEDILQASPVQMDASYLEARRRLDLLEAQLKEFSIYLKPRHPKIITIQNEITRAKNMLQIHEQQALTDLSERKRMLQARIDNLEVVASEWEVTALETSRLQAEYERLKARLERSRSTYQRLLASTESITLSKNIETDTVSVFEPATYPWQQKQSFAANVAQGGVAGLLLGVGIIALLGAADSRLISAEDIRKRFEQPVLAVIPMERRNRNKRVELLRPKDTRHFFAEACRTLRSSLLFLQTPDGRSVKTVAITSAVPEEGKSTITLNLAVALSFTASRTLVIDADLRRGHLASHIGLPASPGLAEYLQGQVPLEQVIRRTTYENLDFISTGAYPERPGELLLSHRMDALLAELGPRYDFIIFDTAPILAADDTSGFAARSDGVLFVVRSAHAQSGQVKASVDRLYMRGATVPGFILNCVDLGGSDYYYYQKYNNYYAATGAEGEK